MKTIISFYKNIISCAFIIISISMSAQYIDVKESYTDEQLVKDIFIGSGNLGCIDVSNVSFSGNRFSNGDNSYGYFNRNGSSFAMDEGIILTTGRAQNAIGPNNRIISQGSWEGDRDLEIATNVRNTYDATILEFDFIAYQTNRISFDYIFASEQYLRLGDPGSCGYTDAFAFLIKEADTANPYINLAVIPGTSTPITSNNVRGRGGRCQAQNEHYFGKYNPDESPTNYNGETAILTASTDIIPGKKYHIKLVIADQGNSLYDSAVFLKAGSFNGNKILGEDRLISERNALCFGELLTLDATTTGATYQWYKDGNVIPTANQATYTVTETGIYNVKINTGTCTLEGNIIVEYLPQFNIIGEEIFYFCDEDFSENYRVNFLNDINPQLIQNHNSYDIKYYLNRNDAENGNSNFLPNEWTFTAETSLFARVSNGYCPASVKEIQLKTNPKIPLNTVSPIEICNHLLANSVEINLGDYQNLFTNSATATFYETLANAQNKTNPINFNQNISANKTFYLRFENATDCPNIGELSFIFKQPRKSETLINKTICQNATTTLNAGTGFDSYLWSNGETSSAITVGIGEYFVDLASNGCIYRQYVNITTSENPVINSVIVEGSTVTINVSGGTGTYLYSINGTDWFSNPQFYNIARGTHSAFVKDTNECAIVEEPFIIINLINAITPNNDGVNDVLDYSDLKIKTNVSIEIYDRYGKRIYESQNDNFIWNGTSGGRTVPSGTYWYILKWTEPATGEQKLYSNWILVKNR